MPLDAAVFKPKTEAVPPVSAPDPEAEAEADFDDAGDHDVVTAVPPLWERVPPTPQAPEDVLATVPKVRRETPAQSQTHVAAPPVPPAAPRDEVRDRLSTMVETRSRHADYGSPTSILGLDSSNGGSEREYDSARFWEH